MSRIGKNPVTITDGVNVTVSPENVITVKGPKGELKQTIDRDIKVEVKDDKVEFVRPTDQIRHRAMHGLYRSLVNNMVKGVTDCFSSPFGPLTVTTFSGLTVMLTPSVIVTGFLPILDILYLFFPCPFLRDRGLIDVTQNFTTHILSLCFFISHYTFRCRNDRNA